MIIEQGFYSNAEFIWKLVGGTSGQMLAAVKFNGNVDKYKELNDEVFMKAFGFHINAGEISPGTDFRWNRHAEENVYVVSWQFMFESLPANMQKFQYLNHIFKAVNQINSKLFPGT